MTETFTSADEAWKEQWDISQYGHDHFDYIITISLEALRKYDEWRGDREDPLAVDYVVAQTGLTLDQATRIHEIILRTQRYRDPKLVVPHRRVVGQAVKYEYISPIDLPTPCYGA